MYLPENLSWDNGPKISNEKRKAIISNIIQGLYLLGSWAVIYPDGRSGMLEASLHNKDEEVRTYIEIENFGITEQQRERLSIFVPENSSLYASGINLQAYRRPGDPSALIERGLTPYETTERFKAIWEQVEAHEDASYLERSCTYVDDLSTIYIAAMGDLKFFPGPGGLSDYKFITHWVRFLSAPENTVTSINGVPVPSIRPLLEELSTKERIFTARDSAAFVSHCCRRKTYCSPQIS